MKTSVAQEFAKFMAAVFPLGTAISTVQHAEMRRAFFAGCALAYSSTENHWPEVQEFFALVGKGGR